jgi:hypothetical protein
MLRRPVESAIHRRCRPASQRRQEELAVLKGVAVRITLQVRENGTRMLRRNLTRQRRRAEPSRAQQHHSRVTTQGELGFEEV